MSLAIRGFGARTHANCKLCKTLCAENPPKMQLADWIAFFQHNLSFNTLPHSGQFFTAVSLIQAYRSAWLAGEHLGHKVSKLVLGEG